VERPHGGPDGARHHLRVDRGAADVAVIQRLLDTLTLASDVAPAPVKSRKPRAKRDAA
jgi:hypothetical protein